jgi:hypothetical protein
MTAIDLNDVKTILAIAISAFAIVCNSTSGDRQAPGAAPDTAGKS